MESFSLNELRWTVDQASGNIDQNKHQNSQYYLEVLIRNRSIAKIQLTISVPIV